MKRNPLEKAALVGITVLVHFVVVPIVMLYFGVRQAFKDTVSE